MALLTTPASVRGFVAPNFTLLGTDDKYHTLSEIKGSKATLIMFICNHCPYVQALITEIVKTANLLSKEQVNTVSIMPNDVADYPDDSFENMKLFAKKHNFTFPYLIDKEQEVAKAYNAVCTPDFFVFDSSLKLAYRGCLINKSTQNNDLLDATIQIINTGSTTIKELPSIGCSIKWKNK